MFHVKHRRCVVVLSRMPGLDGLVAVSQTCVVLGMDFVAVTFRSITVLSFHVKHDLFFAYDGRGVVLG